jgi:flagellar biogenesis protein FliO
MNPFEFIFAVLLLVFAFAFLVKRMELQRKSAPGSEEPAENARLRGQVQQLQERIRVLERIVTDRGVETAAQIEALRDREKMTEEDKA